MTEGELNGERERERQKFKINNNDDKKTHKRMIYNKIS